MTQRPDMNDWEDQINALLDGELDDAQADALKGAAEQDQALARAIIEAYQLQQLMASLPVERAPDSLRRKLAAIPEEQTSAARAVEAINRKPRFGWLRPQWAMALAAVPLVIALVVSQQGPKQPSEEELAQARQDLALAFAYLEKATKVTEREIEYSIGTGMRDPVRGTTIQSIVEQFKFDKEQEA